MKVAQTFRDHYIDSMESPQASVGTPFTHRTYLKIKDQDTEDRPREKLQSLGPHALSKAELLAIALGSGVPNINSVDLAKHILKAYDGNLHQLALLSPKDLERFKGIGKAKATLITAIMELARRFQEEPPSSNLIINTPEAAYQLMKDKLTSKVSEEFWVILLNNNSRVIKSVQISKGGLSRTTVDNRLIFKEGFRYNAVGIILVHNHPSGNPEPSATDIQLTKNLVTGARTVGLRIVDHIIFCDTNHFSFGDAGLL